MQPFTPHELRAARALLAQGDDLSDPSRPIAVPEPVGEVHLMLAALLLRVAETQARIERKLDEVLGA